MAGPLHYKVENHAVGKDGEKPTLKSRHPEGVQPGPPNSQVQPVDTKGRNYEYSSAVYVENRNSRNFQTILLQCKPRGQSNKYQIVLE